MDSVQTVFLSYETQDLDTVEDFQKVEAIMTEVV